MERKPFRVEINGQEHILSLGRCALVLFRLAEFRHQSYLAVYGEDEQVTRAYGDLSLLYLMAGYMFKDDEDGTLWRHPTFWTREGSDEEITFRNQHGWNPTTIEREEPNNNDTRLYNAYVVHESLKAAEHIDEEWMGEGNQ